MNLSLNAAAKSVAIVFATLLSWSIYTPHAARAEIKIKKESPKVERYDRVSFMRGPHVMKYFDRHEKTFRHGAAIHVAHGKAHDLAQRTPLDQREKADQKFDREMVDLLLNKAPKTEVEMRTYGPYVSQFAWDLYRTIDWTHVHHDQTYSILSEPSIPWNKKREWTDKAVRHYLEKFDLPRSPAPLDVTMRRAGTMMKPYFGYFRTHYPQSNSYFYVAHWWHPAIYEAQMIGGNDQEQEKAIQQAEANLPLALSMRPQRMLLSREIMPRYSALSPESANIFDNLHMLHGIAYDILTYPHWTPAQKKTELDRVIRAMSYQPGDEKLARKFRTPRHDMDPRRYEPWMISVEGEMNRIMVEMMNEMMPHIMPKATRKMKKDAMAQLWQKLTPGLQDGEPPGSFHDALLKISPRMVMMSGTMEPGESNPIMMQTMMKGWTEKYAMLPELPRMAMTREPSLKSLQMAGMVNTSESKEAQK